MTPFVDVAVVVLLRVLPPKASSGLSGLLTVSWCSDAVSCPDDPVVVASPMPALGLPPLVPGLLSLPQDGGWKTILAAAASA